MKMAASTNDNSSLEVELEPFLSTPFLESHSSRFYSRWYRNIKPNSSILLSLLFCFIFLLGLLLGRASSQYSSSLSRETGGSLLSTPGNVHQVWQHNVTYSQFPTLDSENAWNALAPVGRGFITHPRIAPFVSNIAAFHQLHCLHALLLSHYALEAEVRTLKAGNASSGREGSEGGFSFEFLGREIDTYHSQHCFDYLRRSIMCAADTNLEVVDAETLVVNGWGQTKICRDYDAVLRFAERWRNSNDTGINS